MRACIHLYTREPQHPVYDSRQHSTLCRPPWSAYIHTCMYIHTREPQRPVYDSRKHSTLCRPPWSAYIHTHACTYIQGSHNIQYMTHVNIPRCAGDHGVCYKFCQLAQERGRALCGPAVAAHSSVGCPAEETAVLSYVRFQQPRYHSASH